MSEPAPLHAWLIEPLEPAVESAIERIRRAEDVAQIAIMPDVHLSKEVCVGTVIATRRLLYPAAVGGDIGCGMLAMAFDVDAAPLGNPKLAGTILHDIREKVPILRRNRARTLSLPESLARAHLSDQRLQRVLREDGSLQLGTLGGGNHFIELQQDEEHRLWLMIHSGSRAMGQAVRTHHLARGNKAAGGMVALDVSTDGGREYLHDVEWARKYADANRRLMGDQVRAILLAHLGAHADESLTIACDHNHVAVEEHYGQPMLIHRKGAMPAAAGTSGVIPGSMGTCSYHVAGLGCEAALQSSSHGAGRRLSRTKARETYRSGDVRAQMGHIWFDPSLTEHLREEAPRAYKDVRKVMEAQRDLVKRVRTLRPVMVYKGT